jgi:ribosome-binding factor A
LAKFSKKDQYEQEIQKEVNNYLRTSADNRHLSFVSVTKVELSPDFSYATLFWDTFDPSKRGDITKAMESSLGRIRKHLADNLKVRHTPSLSAKYDSQFEDEQAIDDLLQNERDKGKDF